MSTFNAKWFADIADRAASVGRAAFTPRNLRVLAYASGYTSWLYQGDKTQAFAEVYAPVTLADVRRPGFFATDMVQVGDTIMCVCADGTTIRCVHSTVGGTVVTTPLS